MYFDILASEYIEQQPAYTIYSILSKGLTLYHAIIYSPICSKFFPALRLVSFPYVYCLCNIRPSIADICFPYKQKIRKKLYTVSRLLRMFSCKSFYRRRLSAFFTLVPHASREYLQVIWEVIWVCGSELAFSLPLSSLIISYSAASAAAVKIRWKRWTINLATIKSLP